MKLLPSSRSGLAKTTSNFLFDNVNAAFVDSRAAFFVAKLLCNNKGVLVLERFRIVPTFTESDILGQLDDCAIKFDFPMLDNGNVAPVDVRLHAYTDKSRWAIIIEDLGFHVRAGGHDGVTNCLYYFGNCLYRKPGSALADFVFPTSDAPGEPTFQEEINMFLREPKGHVGVRDKLISFDCTPEKLSEKDIVETDEQPTGTELMRSLVTEYRELFFATEQELRRQIPADLPMVLQIESWHHPDLAGDELPSANETFQHIAKVLCLGDKNKYTPTLQANTHWSNWPDGGTL